MTRAESVKALAKLRDDPVFLAAYAAGDPAAVATVKEISEARVGTADSWQSGKLSTEELNVDKF